MSHSFNHRPEGEIREPRMPSGRRALARHERYPFDIDSEFDDDDLDLTPPAEEFQADRSQAGVT